MKEIKIKCRGHIEIPYDKLTHFQSGLKDLSKENYDKMKRSILKYGFSEPCSVWLNDGKYKILNAHQRVRTIKNMVEVEGYKCPPLPCSLIEAENYKEAREKVLALTSQYGEMSYENLQTYLDESDLDLESILEDFRFPEININTININEINAADENEEWVNMPDFKEGGDYIKLTYIFGSKESRDNFINENNISVDRKVNENSWICYR